MPKTIAVLGAGSWGTALAIHLVKNKHHVTLWGHDHEQIQRMSASHYNNQFLPNVKLPEALKLTDQLEVAFKNAEVIVIVVPSHAFAEVLGKIKPLWNPQQKIISATKGLDPVTGDFLHEVAYRTLGDELQMGILTGPSFAKEVAQGLPAAIAIAAKQEETAKYFQEIFHSNKLRVYPTNDLVGVSICGSAKNVLAIATGLAEGLGLGANARAALITRGVAEISRLADKLGASRDTIMGLAGLGDLILTCTDTQSRNFRFGIALGQGLSIADSLKKIDQVVEGINTSFLIQKMARRFQIEMPIIDQVVAVLNHEKSPAAAMTALLERPPNVEMR